MELFINMKSRAPGFVSLLGIILFAVYGQCQAQTTYGYEDSTGAFVPKVTVELNQKTIKIEKVKPREKFRSIEMRINPRNNALRDNKSLLQIVWVNQAGEDGRPIPFTGPRYVHENIAFRDTMTKSKALKIIDESNKALFRNQELRDLFLLFVNNKELIPEEESSGSETGVSLPETQEKRIIVDSDSIEFNTISSLKRGTTINIDNPTGFHQIIGLEFPDSKLFYMRKVHWRPEQTEVPEADWGNISIPPNSGLFIVIIPEPRPLALSQLHGTEITLKIYDGTQIAELIRIPISISRDLRVPDSNGSREISDGSNEGVGFVPPDQGEGTTTEPKPVENSDPGPTPTPSKAPAQGIGLMAWVAIILSVTVSIVVALYVIFFILPKIQALEDRLAKNEMFLHGSREAIREELELTKEEILKQCLPDSSDK